LKWSGFIVIPKAIREALGVGRAIPYPDPRPPWRLIDPQDTLEEIIAETDRQCEAGETLPLEEAFKDLV